jgi:hypothetical protein
MRLRCSAAAAYRQLTLRRKIKPLDTKGRVAPKKILLVTDFSTAPDYPEQHHSLAGSAFLAGIDDRVWSCERAV